MSTFSVRNVSFAYPGCPNSLDDVSFEVEPGERVALLGANGSGKSTLLHLLNGLYFPNRGHIEAFGTELTEESLATSFGPRFRRDVGFLFQNSEAQLFNPTVEEDVAFGPLQLGLPRQEADGRVEDTLALLGITHLRSRAPQSLSAGQKKAVALASVLVLSPAVLLLDEPTAELDARSQALLLEVLEELTARGVTLITSTHDLPLLDRLADRAIVLGEDHRITWEGSVPDLVRDEGLLFRTNLSHPKLRPAHR